MVRRRFRHAAADFRVKRCGNSIPRLHLRPLPLRQPCFICSTFNDYFRPAPASLFIERAKRRRGCGRERQTGTTGNWCGGRAAATGTPSRPWWAATGTWCTRRPSAAWASGGRAGRRPGSVHRGLRPAGAAPRAGEVRALAAAAGAQRLRGQLCAGVGRGALPGRDGLQAMSTPDDAEGVAHAAGRAGGAGTPAGADAPDGHALLPRRLLARRSRPLPGHPRQHRPQPPGARQTPTAGGDAGDGTRRTERGQAGRRLDPADGGRGDAARAGGRVRAIEKGEAVGHYDEALAAIGTLPPGAEQKRLTMDALWRKGKAADPLRFGSEEGLALLEQSLALAEELGDKRGQMRKLMDMGSAFYNSGQDAKGAGCFERARALAQELGDARGQARCLTGLGTGAAVGRRGAGAVLFAQALPLYEAAGDLNGATYCRAMLAVADRLGPDNLRVGFSPGGAFNQPIIGFYAGCDTFRAEGGVVSQEWRDLLHRLHLAGGAARARRSRSAASSGRRRTCGTILDGDVPVGGGWSGPAFSNTSEPLKATVTVLSDTETVTVPAGTFAGCLLTEQVTTEDGPATRPKGILRHGPRLVRAGRRAGPASRPARGRPGSDPATASVRGGTGKRGLPAAGRRQPLGVRMGGRARRVCRPGSVPGDRAEGRPVVRRALCVCVRRHVKRTHRRLGRQLPLP